MTVSKLLPCLCLLTCFLRWSVSKGSNHIRVKTGDDVTLKCLDPQGGIIKLLEWTRVDLKDGGYLFYFKDKRIYDNYQHSEFKNRVELADKTMTNGNFSVILKKVTFNDSGTYECYVAYGGKPQLITNITLTVRLPGDEEQERQKGPKDGGTKDGGNNSKYIGLIVGLLVVVVVVGGGAFVVYRKFKGVKQESSYKPTTKSDSDSKV